MIVTLEETRQYLRIDDSESDMLLISLIAAAEEYLKNATGNQFDSANPLARLFCLVLITDWFENREHTGKASDKVRPIVDSMLAQLRHCYQPPEEGES